jgi:signal transduction histidine kinase
MTLSSMSPSHSLHRTQASCGPARRLVASVLAAAVLGVAAPVRPVAAAGDASRIPAKRVLILQSFGSDFAPYSVLASSFRSALGADLGEAVEFLEVAVTATAASNPQMESALAGYLESLEEQWLPDLALAVGGQAGSFVVANRQHLFSATPVLFAGVDRRLIPVDKLTVGDAVVPSDHNLPVLVENILEVLPRTETIAVVIGSSPLERFWRSELGRDFERFENDVRIVWWDDLAAPEVQRRAAALPPRSAILYTLFLIDGAGVPHANQVFLRSLHEVASAPIFGIFDTQLGEGVVGGRAMPITAISRLCADAAAAVLRGGRPSVSRFSAVTYGAPVYDGRELARWGIGDRDLPPDSTVLFRPPSIWVLYRWPILGSLGVIISLASMVVALNLHRVRLSAAEREVRGLSRRLLTAIEEERRRLGRELHDDVSQRLAGLAIDAARIERELQSAPARAAELCALREEIVALSADLHALSRWLHPSVLDDLGLVEALHAEADRFMRMESISIELQLDEPEPRLSEDSALCLYRIAQEALRNVARHAAAATVVISLRAKSGGCELEVRDDGVGFEVDRRQGRGLGLASMHERAQLAGGRFAVTSAPQRGASVVAWVPLERGEAG